MKIYPFLIKTSIMLAILLYSCSKNNSSPSASSPLSATVDKNYYFKITFKGQTFTNYGMLFNGTKLPTILGDPSTYNNSFNQLESTLDIISNGTQLNAEFYNKPPYNYNYRQQLNVFYSIKKSGNLLGQHTGSFSYIIITDLLIGNKQYEFEESTFSHNITAIGVDYISGTFSGKLKEGNTLIPASGDFRVYRQ